MKRFNIEKHGDKFRAKLAGTQHRESVSSKITFLPNEPLAAGDLVVQEFKTGSVTLRFTGYGAPFTADNMFSEGSAANAHGYFELVDGKFLAGGRQSVNGVKTITGE